MMLFQSLLFCLLFVQAACGFQGELSSAVTPSVPRAGLRDQPVALTTLTHPTNERHLLPLKASETSLDWTNAISTKADAWKAAVGEAAADFVPPSVQQAPSVLWSVLRKGWWMMPMILAVVPIYCAMQGTCASMPHWWPMKDLKYLLQSKYAVAVVGGFLGSNIAYFGSGTYLLHRFPLQRTDNKTLLPFQPTPFALLGIWMWTAGLVSTIFHSVQALGSFSVAQAWCFVDHGVAISAGFYFLDTCGFPSRKVLGLGILSLATLALTAPGYAFLHSTWHFLSAGTATLWAMEGYRRRRSPL